MEEWLQLLLTSQPNRRFALINLIEGAAVAQGIRQGAIITFKTPDFADIIQKADAVGLWAKKYPMGNEGNTILLRKDKEQLKPAYDSLEELGEINGKQEFHRATGEILGYLTPFTMSKNNIGRSPYGMMGSIVLRSPEGFVDNLQILPQRIVGNPMEYASRFFDQLQQYYALVLPAGYSVGSVTLVMQQHVPRPAAGAAAGSASTRRRRRRSRRH